MKKLSSLLAMLLVVAVSLTACTSYEYLSSDNIDDYIILGDYIGLEYTYTSTDVTDEDVEDQIASVLSDYAEEVEVTDRAVQDGDIVNIDFVGSVDGEEFDGGTSEGYDLEIGSDTFIDDFESQLIGAEIGDVIDVEVTFPDPYTNNTDLSGAEAVFVVTINSITEVITPELTDEWVAENTSYETAEEYTEYIYTALVESKESEALYNKELELIELLVANSTIIEYPSGDVEDYKTSMKSYYISYAEAYSMDIDEFVETYYGITLTELEAELDAQAEVQVGYMLVLAAVAQAEGISLTDEEYEEQATALAISYGYDTLEEFEEANTKDIIMESLVNDLALEFVMDNAVAVEADEE